MYSRDFEQNFAIELGQREDSRFFDCFKLKKKNEVTSSAVFCHPDKSTFQCSTAKTPFFFFPF